MDAQAIQTILSTLRNKLLRQQTAVELTTQQILNYEDQVERLKKEGPTK